MDNNRIKIVINSNHPELFEISKSFCDNLPFEVLLVDGSGGMYGFWYLEYIKNNLDCDWIISIDEDCFIIDTKGVLDLLQYQIDNDFSFSGMPDGGVANHRVANPIAINTFFTIINMKKLREVDINNSSYDDDLKNFFPKELIKTDYQFNNFEPYYCIFFSMLRNNNKPLYLDAYDFEMDNFSTVLKNHNGIDIAIHSWMSRAWGNIENKERILKIIEIAKLLKKS